MSDGQGSLEVKLMDKTSPDVLPLKIERMGNVAMNHLNDKETESIVEFMSSPEFHHTIQRVDGSKMIIKRMAEEAPVINKDFTWCEVVYERQGDKNDLPVALKQGTLSIVHKPTGCLLPTFFTMERGLMEKFMTGQAERMFQKYPGVQDIIEGQVETRARDEEKRLVEGCAWETLINPNTTSAKRIQHCYQAAREMWMEMQRLQFIPLMMLEGWRDYMELSIRQPTAMQGLKNIPKRLNEDGTLNPAGQIEPFTFHKYLPQVELPTGPHRSFNPGVCYTMVHQMENSVKGACHFRSSNPFIFLPTGPTGVDQIWLLGKDAFNPLTAIGKVKHQRPEIDFELVEQINGVSYSIFMFVMQYPVKGGDGEMTVARTCFNCMYYPMVAAMLDDSCQQLGTCAFKSVYSGLRQQICAVLEGSTFAACGTPHQPMIIDNSGPDLFGSILSNQARTIAERVYEQSAILVNKEILALGNTTDETRMKIEQWTLDHKDEIDSYEKSGSLLEQLVQGATTKEREAYPQYRRKLEEDGLTGTGKGLAEGKLTDNDGRRVYV